MSVLKPSHLYECTKCSRRRALKTGAIAHVQMMAQCGHCGVSLHKLVAKGLPRRKREELHTQVWRTRMLAAVPMSPVEALDEARRAMAMASLMLAGMILMAGIMLVWLRWVRMDNRAMRSPRVDDWDDDARFEAGEHVCEFVRGGNATHYQCACGAILPAHKEPRCQQLPKPVILTKEPMIIGGVAMDDASVISDACNRRDSSR